MADETLKYRVEIDETSLTSELARTRTAITGAMQQAVQTGQYAVNNIHADLAMARAQMALPAVPFAASPGAQLQGFSAAVATPLADFGFLGAARVAAGGAVPTNMMSDDAQRWARMELEQRAFNMTAGIGRQAFPVAGALGGIGLGALSGFGPLGSLGLGAAGFVGGDLLARPIFEAMEQRQTAGDILAMTKAPHPMRRFDRDQQTELARGLAMDVAKDVRFGVEELSQLLAGAHANDMFAGVRGVEEFRGRFRSMLDQIRSITRVFSQTTEEAMQTLGQLGQMGPVTGMGGRIADIHALARMGGMPAGAAMDIGMGGARMAGAMGVPMGAGFDVMTRNAQMAVAGEAMGFFDPTMFRQMGGAQGVAERATRFGFQASGSLGNLLPAFANDAMNGIDQARLQQFISGQLSYDDVQQAAWNRMVDPASRTRYAANADLIQNQLAVSGLAGPAMFRFAQMRGEMTGVPAEDIFNRMAAEMGLTHPERQLALSFSRDRGQFAAIADRERDAAEYRIQLERYKEESRFSNRFSAKMEEWQVGLSSALGDPAKKLGDWISGGVESVVTAPQRLLNWLDVAAGKAIFGERGAPVMPTGMQGGMGVTGVGDIVRTGRFLTGGGMSAGDARGGGMAKLNALRAVEMMSMEQAEKNFGNAVRSVLWKSDVRGEDFKLAAKMSSDDQEAFEEEAVATFAPDLAELMSESDPSRRKEKEAGIRQRMNDWVKTKFGSAVDVDAMGDFADKMFSIEKVAQRDDVVKRGIMDAAHASAVIQTRNYVGAELPALLSMAAEEGKGGQAMEVGRQIAAQFSGSPNEASFHALKGIAERALPMMREGTVLRDRAKVVENIMQMGYLRPGDMELSTRELATAKAMASNAGQEAFVNELIKASKDAEGHKITADVLFRSVGMGLGGEAPSNTPGPSVGLDSAKWDLTSQALDKLTGAVNNLSTASEKLIGMADSQAKRSAGKM